MENLGINLMSSIYLMLVIVGIFVMIMVARVMSARSREGSARGNPAFQQLGYRSMGAKKYGRGRVSTHYVRTVDGHEVHYVMDIKSGLRKSEYASAWICPLTSSSDLNLQVVEAGIADDSLVARVSNAVDSHKYDWKQEFAERIRTGDAELDKRFAMFGSDKTAVKDFLTVSAVRENLLGLKHVDLTLTEAEARLDDPFLINVWGLDGQPLVDVHNQVAELLTSAARGV